MRRPGHPSTPKSSAVAVGYSDTWNDGDNSHSLNQGCGSSKNSHVFWFKWVNDSGTGSFTADTVGSSIDTVLSVYANGKLLGCDDDGAGSGDSRVVFDAQSGKTYYFAVTSYDGDAGGSFAFNFYD